MTPAELKRLRELSGKNIAVNPATVLALLSELERLRKVEEAARRVDSDINYNCVCDDDYGFTCAMCNLNHALVALDACGGKDNEGEREAAWLKTHGTRAEGQ